MSSNPTKSKANYGSSGKTGGSGNVATNAAYGSGNSGNGGNGGNGSGSGNGGNGGNGGNAGGNNAATMSSTSSQKNNDPSQAVPLYSLLQSYAAKWSPATNGLITGSGDSNDSKTLGEWLNDPRLEPYMNNKFFIEGPLGSDSIYAGYTILESADVINGEYWPVLLMTPNP